MKRYLVSMALYSLVMNAAVVMADTTINFDAQVFRAGNDGTYGTIIENVKGDGFTATTTGAGQKVLYGTTALNGASLADIKSISFTALSQTGLSIPYLNVVVTNGEGGYGVLSFTAPSDVKNLETGEVTRTYAINGATVKLNEPSGTDNIKDNSGSSIKNGTKIYWYANPSWEDVSDISLLGVGDTRPLSSDSSLFTGTAVPESVAGARAPVEFGLAITWGDSASNFLGTQTVYDITITMMDGNVYKAGNVVPAPAALLLGSMGLGLVGWMKRRLA